MNYDQFIGSRIEVTLADMIADKRVCIEDRTFPSYYSYSGDDNSGHIGIDSDVFRVHVATKELSSPSLAQAERFLWEEWFATDQDKVHEIAREAGYSHDHTGGGCTALRFDLPNGDWIWITDMDASIPENLTEACHACHYPLNDEGDNWTQISEGECLEKTIQEVKTHLQYVKTSRIQLIDKPYYLIDDETVPKDSPVGNAITTLIEKSWHLKAHLDPAHFDALDQVLEAQSLTLLRG